MNHKALTGAEIETLARQLTSRLSEFELEMITYTVTGDRLHEAYVSNKLPIGEQIYELLNRLERFGITRSFVSEVYRRSPDRLDLRTAWLRLYPDIEAEPQERGTELALQVGGVDVEDAPTLAAAPGLEKNIRPNLPFLEVRTWLENLAKLESRVCRIEHLNCNAMGTGFLVGPSSVLTNWHVVERLQKADSIGDCACRFDYLRILGNTRNTGSTTKVLEVSSYRPYSEGEGNGTPDDPPPTPEELDYALLKLADQLGDRRGWVTLPKDQKLPLKHNPLLIIQHPDGSPMKLALDTQAVFGEVHDGLRLRYATNTEPGSSGSPCFDIEWNPIAMHHMGDPTWAATYNQGIPLSLIRTAIQSDGKADLLGQ